jgi:hypothetical protein
VTAAAEKALPSQAGYWKKWKDWHGIKSRYRAWRGPLSITAAGDVLLVQAHIRYWIRVHKKVLGAVTLGGSCGVDEPPRQAIIAMQVRLDWGPDWSLQPEFRILPTRFLDRCEMTIANIDVTPLIEKEFRRQMQNSLRSALRNLEPGVNAIQRQAQRTWTLLQQPVAIGQDHWLLLRPAGVALSRPSGRGSYIDAQLAVSLRPELASSPPAADQLTPLPLLARYYPRTTGLTLRLGVDLDFEQINRQLATTLQGKSFDINGRQTGLKRFELTGSGQQIGARLELTGEVAGNADLHAKLAFDAQDGKLVLHDLVFDYAADNAAMDLLVEAFHEPIRLALENAANQALARQLGLLGTRLEAVMKKITPAGVTLDMSALQFTRLQIQIVEQGIRLDGTATGNIRLVLR